MADSRIHGPRGQSIEFHQEYIDVTSASGAPDPHWRHTDQAGHEHYASGGCPVTYPTLAVRESRPYWCDSCGDEHTDTWRECPACGERITPRRLSGPWREMIPGPLSCVLTEELYGDEAVAAAQADRTPDILEIMFTQNASGFRTRRLRQLTREQAKEIIRTWRTDGPVRHRLQ